MTDLARLDATAQAELVRKGAASPAELVDAALARLERVNPALNAVVTPMAERAREAAAGPLPDGPFRGVPFLLKDLQALCAGVRYTGGSRLLADFVSPLDAEIVTRHRRAGLVVIGKTNTPEFGILPVTEPALFGPARNPWDTERTTGGSSGGSAAAVAAGIVPMAHGNDGGGSIRIPASCCGVFGMKPTRARITLGPLVGDVMNGLVVDHALTRSVRDSAALLDATQGPLPGDPYMAPPPARPFLEEVGADPGRLRIAWTDRPAIGTEVQADCRAAVREAAGLCEGLGHHVEEAAPPISGEELYGAFLTVWAAGVAAGVDLVAGTLGRAVSAEKLEPLTAGLHAAGGRVPAPRYLNAIAALQRTARVVAAFMLGYDVLLTPTVARPPIRHGELRQDEGDAMDALRRAAEFVPFTGLFNATGQPAMSVPLHWNAEGLPIGVQFTGRYGDEATLFRLAAQLEAARPWADRTPPVWAGD
jgi:amidase